LILHIFTEGRSLIDWMTRRREALEGKESQVPQFLDPKSGNAKNLHWLIEERRIKPHIPLSHNTLASLIPLSVRP